MIQLPGFDDTKRRGQSHRPGLPGSESELRLQVLTVRGSISGAVGASRAIYMYDSTGIVSALLPFWSTKLHNIAYNYIDNA